jgi:magnesium transporter
VTALAQRIGVLERRVVQGDLARPQQLIEQMFQLRHEVLTIVTMAAQCREVYARGGDARAICPSEARVFIADLEIQFEAVRSLGNGEERFLQGVVDFYQTRVATQLNQFAKLLTSVGAILVLATLVAGIHGMNFRYMPELEWRFGYPMALGLMVVLGVLLSWYFHRRHWL